ncbi:Ubiquitin-associated and SH3 domain-containing protein A, partial [Schistosoma japonicum]
ALIRTRLLLLSLLSTRQRSKGIAPAFNTFKSTLGLSKFCKVAHGAEFSCGLMTTKIYDLPPNLLDLSVINKGQKIINGLKNSKFPTDYAISSRLNDPLFTKDFDVDFHVYLSLGSRCESDIMSFLSAARVAVGWSYVCDHPAQIPLLHLRVKPYDALHFVSIFVKSFDLPETFSLASGEMLEFSVNVGASVVCGFSNSKIYTLLQKLANTFLENLAKAGINVFVISNPNTINYSVTLVSSVNCAEKSSILVQLKEMHLSDHYIISGLNQSVNPQLKFCLYSHDPRLRDSSCEVFEMLTDMEPDSSSSLISSHITNDCNKIGHQKSPASFVVHDKNSVDSCNNSQSRCDMYSNQPSACVTNSPGSQARLLEHYVGDYVLLIDSVSLNERLGCPLGINLCTGESGLFHMSAGRRVPQSQTWTLHCSVPLNLTSRNNANYSEEFKKQISQNSSLIAKNISSSCPLLSSCLSTSSEHSSASFSSSSSSSDPEKSKLSVQSTLATINNDSNVYNNTDKHILDNQCNSYFTTYVTTSCQSEFQLTMNNMNNDDELNKSNCKVNNKFTNYQRTIKRRSHNKSRQMYVMRHAERVDISFGHGWITQCFDHKDLSIRIEPHLFEWYGWYVGGCIPKMMTIDQLKLAGYNVDTNYTPLSSYNDYDKHESIQGYFDRTAVLIKRILNVHKSKAHASSLDTCTRHLVYHGFRNHLSIDEFQHRTSIVPYCGFLLAQENRPTTIDKYQFIFSVTSHLLLLLLLLMLYVYF